MSWREQLRKASFRGVPFMVDSAEGDFGRRSQVHEYPLRDLPYVEDLGRKARTIKIEAFVLGDAYMAARDALLAAVEVSGPGTLVHPYLGELRVSITACKLRESTQQGGMATLSIECVESGEATFPSQAASTGQAATDAADAVTSSARASFEARYAVVKKPEFVAQAAQAILGDALTEMTQAAGTVRGTADQVGELSRQVTKVQRDMLTLIYEPASAAGALLGNLQQLVRGVAQGPRDAFALARSFFGFGSDLAAVPLTTAVRRQQATNQAEMVRLVQAAAVAEGARAATGIEFTSFDDAASVRGQLLDAADALMEQEGLDDATFAALRTLSASAVRDITERGADLARLVAYTPQVTQPALVIAHDLYADATREADIVARNNLPHPGFVAGAKAIEVLSDA